MAELVLAAILPHPPLLIPKIGGQRLKEVAATKKAMEAVAKKLKASACDTIIVITPHGQIGQASVPVYTNHVFEGSFAQFGLAKPLYSFRGEPQLAAAIVKDSGLAASCPETILDHGILVPLHYIQAAGLKTPIVPIAIAFMALKQLFSFGQSLAQTIKNSDKKVAIIASADMSHRLTPDAPSGYSPRGKEFDQKLVELVENYDVQGILNFDPVLADEAGQDALWSIAIMLGVLDGLKIKHEVLSYEGPYGVGYMTAVFKEEQ